jgi:predicted ribosomally synthesized peptide with SipW-like signal peptide
MKTISKKVIVTVFSLVLLLIASVGMTVAYFTDYESAKGGAVLKLSGQTELKETVEDNNKTISIKNVGKTDMIVRVKVIGDPKKLTFNAGANWIDNREVDGWWYYGKILKGSPDGDNGESTTDLFAGVSGTVGETDFDIVVVHEASRTVYDVDGEGNPVLVKPNGWTYVPAAEQ